MGEAVVESRDVDMGESMRNFFGSVFNDLLT